MEQTEISIMRWLQKTASFAIAGIFVILFFGLVTPVKAGNQQITFQGKLTNSSGNTVSDGTYYVKLTIYDAATGGSCQYTASSTCSTVTSTPVTVANGIFSINLGDTSAALAAISPTLFNSSALYLGITVCSGAGTGCDSEMTPRKRITAAPYAFNADYLSGLATSTIGGVGSYVPVTDSSGNLKITNSLLIATTTAGQFGVGTTTVPTGIKTFIDSTTASDKLLVIRGNSSQTGNLQEWQNNAGQPLGYVDRLGFLYIGDGSTSSTLQKNLLRVAYSATDLMGKFYVDSSGNVSATGSLRTFGNVTSTGIIYASGGLISSASSTFSNLLNIAGDVRASSTFQVTGNSTLYGYLGIGVNPSYPLHVQKSVNSLFVASIDNQSATGFGLEVRTADSSLNTTGFEVYANDVSTFAVRSDGNTILGVGGILTLGNTSLASVSSTAANLRLAADGARQIQFWTNASQRMYIDSSGNIFASGTFQATGNATLFGSLSVTSNTSSLRSLYLSGLTAAPNTQAGTLYFNSSDAKFYGYTANGTAVDLGAASGTNDWGRFSSTYGALALMTSSTYPVWFDGAVYASSTLTVSGSTNASSSVLTGTSFVLGKGSGWNNGVFSIDASGDVSTSGTLNVAGGPDPTGSVVHPMHRGSVTASNWQLDSAIGVFVSGNYMYVVSNADDALEIFDISTSTPSHVGVLTNGTNGANLDGATSIFVAGNYAYITISTTVDGLEVVDISDPANPKHKGFLGVTASNYLYGANDVFVVGNYAYVATGDAGGNALVIINVSNPSNPVFAGALTDGTNGARLGGASAVKVVNNYAYVVSDGDDALEIVDVSSPVNPVHKGSLSDGGASAPYLSNPYGLFVSGNFVYVTASADNAFEVINISDPTSPTHSGSLTNGTGGALLSVPAGVFVAGNYAYIAVSTSDALEVVDISDPANPRHVSSLVDGTGGAKLESAWSIFLSGNYAYVTNKIGTFGSGTGAVGIVDVSGAVVSNAYIGSTKIDTLQVQNFAQFDQGLLVRSGLNVGGPTQLLGEVSIGGGRATSTDMGGGGLSIFTNQASSTFTSRVFDTGGSTGFIFNSGTSTWTGSDRNLVSFQTGGVDKFLFAADGSVIVNKASSYNSGYLSVGNTGNLSTSGTLMVFGGATTGGLQISATNATTTLTSYVTDAVGSAGFAFNTDVRMTSTTAGSAVDRALAVFQNNGFNKVLVSAGGHVYAAGSFIANSTDYGLTLGDVAEYINLVPGESVEPGDVLVVDDGGLNQYRRSEVNHAKNVAGVVSDTGAFIIGGAAANRAPLALAGLVKVKVSDENGPIAVGDYLATASESGYAMKYDSNSGKSAGLVGMALEPWESGRGKIAVLVNKGLVVGNSAAGSELTVSQNGSGQVVWGNDFNLHLLGRSIVDVLSIKSQDEKWMIDEDGYLVVKVKTQQGDKELYGLQSGQDKEVVFSGSSQLEDGVKKIELPAIDKEIVDVNAPIKVSVTLTGEANGVFVIEKSYEGFTVKELNGGTSDATFDWLVIAKRRVVGDEAVVVEEENNSGADEDTPLEDLESDDESVAPPEETPPEEAVDSEVVETPADAASDATGEVLSEIDAVPANEEGGAGQVDNESPPVESAEKMVVSPEEVPVSDVGEEAVVSTPTESASL